MLCTLADGLRPSPDPGFISEVSLEFPRTTEPLDWVETQGPYLASPAQLSHDVRPYSFFREEYGFVPNLYRVQYIRPDLIEAEVQALERILLSEELLSRIQKEYIVLAISAANLNTYYVTMRGQILSALGGASLEECDQIVENHQHSRISVADKALLDETRKLAALPSSAEGRFEADRLRSQGFSEAQIVEAVVVSGLVNFLNTLQAGVGAVPDFPPRRVFGRKDLYPLPEKARRISDAIPGEIRTLALLRESRTVRSTCLRIWSAATHGASSGPWPGSWETWTMLGMQPRKCS